LRRFRATSVAARPDGAFSLPSIGQDWQLFRVVA